MLKMKFKGASNEKPEGDNIQRISLIVDDLCKVSSKIMRQAQEEYLQIRLVMCYKKLGRKPSLAQIRK